MRGFRNARRAIWPAGTQSATDGFGVDVVSTQMIAMSATTISTNVGRIERHIVPLLGNRRVRDLAKSDITQAMKDIMAGKTPKPPADWEDRDLGTPGPSSKPRERRGGEGDAPSGSPAPQH